MMVTWGAALNNGRADDVAGMHMQSSGQGAGQNRYFFEFHLIFLLEYV